ncbi:hypothetical protein JK151_08945 [Ralstonia syzygii subsp. celebesensis]|uniref:Uncharacterized protein n=2 Tax=Ralstonia syzygii subsp. celebesensis TaxID=1310168 RepID=A0A1U9VEK8_9RALS|nr:hypothetical protein [Ralstonia syzygii]AQW29112.1 hypothetical protein B0B51_03180 [blood disease bacterium A2-HR MARDI]QQV57117.1 hypothetical protein JK151_08945 [Ralstonia syzygii subsp. celebesensis]CCA79402.1 hypothetical protein BDB_60009 [blood disease bacterium R229]
MSNNIVTVRQHLLDTLADLRNRDNPMDIDRARAVADVARVLVDTAKVEVDYIKATCDTRTQFFGETQEAIPVDTGAPSAHNPFPNTVRHVLKG